MSRTCVSCPFKLQFVSRNTKPNTFSLFITYQACLKLMNQLIRKMGCKRSLHHFSHPLLIFCHRVVLTWKNKCELTEGTQPKNLDILLISLQEKGEESRNLKRYIVYINIYYIFPTVNLWGRLRKGEPSFII